MDLILLALLGIDPPLPEFSAQGSGGPPICFLHLKSYFKTPCTLSENGTTPTGRKVTQGEEKRERRRKAGAELFQAQENL